MIKALEEAYAKAECPVVSNNSAHRFTPDVPMVVPEIDPKTANKPDAIKEKMAIGKLGKFYKEACLVDQAFIKDGGMDVKKYVADTAKALGGDIKIAAFTHFTKGEGLEKRNEDFAAEVAAAIKG